MAEKGALRFPIPITDFLQRMGETAFAESIREFDCGEETLNDYLRRFALENHRNDSAKCYVVVQGERLVGFYCLAAAAIHHEDAPQRAVRGLARHDVPAVLLARLAVDRRVQSRGLGTSLLRDALSRAAQAAERIACRVLIVHAKNEAARRFYLSLDFRPLPGNEVHLYLLMKDIRRTLRAH